MHYQKFLWGTAVLLGSFTVAFLWYNFFPATAKGLLNDADNAAVATWNDVVSGGGGQNGQSDMVINNSSSSDGEENATSVDSAPSSTENNIASSAMGDGDENTVSDSGADSSSLPPSPPVSSAVSPAFASSSSDDAGTVTASTSSSPSSPLSVTPSCSFSFSSSSSLSQRVIFNEVAWMGSQGASNGEWMELKNNSGSDIVLSGWELLNASGKIKILFAASDHIPAEGLLLLARASTTFGNGVVAQRTYSGDLRNTGDDLALIDAACGVSDFLEASSTGWPAGNNTTKQTMERNADGVGWHTSVAPGGTPGKANSVPPLPATNQSGVSSGSPAAVVVTGSLDGSNDANATSSEVVSSTSDMAVTSTTASSSVASVETSTSMDSTSTTISASTSTLITSSTPTSTSDATTTPDDTTPTSTPPSAPTSTSTSTNSALSSSSSPDHLLIAAIQIAGATASDDFVKIYNPTFAVADVSGWKLRKKSATGADYSIREFPANTTIAPQQYFTWANSTDGFAASVSADISSTQTLAAANSVALIDANGAIVDAVAWGTGTGQYGEGPPFPTDPGSGQTLARQSANGAMVDTDNNANDFVLQ